jgi:Trk-type K+ transport system membrane component
MPGSHGRGIEAALVNTFWLMVYFAIAWTFLEESSGTVGLSLGLTLHLSPGEKCIIILSMLAGMRIPLTDE